MVFEIFLALAGIASVPAVLVRRRRQKQELRRPMINGTYLPATNDIRWRRCKHNGAVLKLGKFEIDSRSGQILFDYDHLGFWKAYVRAVEKVVKKAYHERRNERALKEIEDAK